MNMLEQRTAGMPSGVRPDSFRSLPTSFYETHFEETTIAAVHAAAGDSRDMALSAPSSHGRSRRTDCLARDCGRPVVSIWLSDNPAPRSVVRVEEQHSTSLTPGFMPFLPAQDRPGVADARWERTTVVSALSLCDVRLTAGDRDFPSSVARPARCSPHPILGGPNGPTAAPVRTSLTLTLYGSATFITSREVTPPSSDPTHHFREARSSHGACRAAHHGGSGLAHARASLARPDELPGHSRLTHASSAPRGAIGIRPGPSVPHRLPRRATVSVAWNAHSASRVRHTPDHAPAPVGPAGFPSTISTDPFSDIHLFDGTTSGPRRRRRCPLRQPPVLLYPITHPKLEQRRESSPIPVPNPSPQLYEQRQQDHSRWKPRGGS